MTTDTAYTKVRCLIQDDCDPPTVRDLTITMLVKQTKLSSSTVRRVLDEMISQGVVERYRAFGSRRYYYRVSNNVLATFRMANDWHNT